MFSFPPKVSSTCCKHSEFSLLAERVKGLTWDSLNPAEKKVCLDSEEDTCQAGSQKERLSKRVKAF